MGLFASETPIKTSEGWEVKIIDENGKLHNTIKKKTKEDAEAAIKQINEDADKAFHNSIINIQSDLPMDDIPGFNEEAEREFDQQIEAIEAEAKAKAKAYLDQIIRLFFEARNITDTEYIKKKHELETMTLSSMIEQLNISKMIARKLAKQIYTQGNVGARMYEVYGSLNRVILDSGKFLHEYMSSLETNAKDVHAEHDQQAQVIESGGGAAMLGDGASATFNNATKLLGVVKQIAEEINTPYKIPGSRNPKLRGNIEEIEEVSYVESEEEKLDDEYDPFNSSLNK